MNEMSILGSGVLFPVFDLLNSDDASEDLKKQSLMLLSNLATNGTRTTNYQIRQVLYISKYRTSPCFYSLLRVARTSDEFIVQLTHGHQRTGLAICDQHYIRRYAVTGLNSTSDINILRAEYCRKQLLDTGAVDLINGKKPQWSSGTEQINKLSLMAIENLLTPST
jgi:hypothetical protein